MTPDFLHKATLGVFNRHYPIFFILGMGTPSSSVAFVQRSCIYNLFSFFKAVMVYNVAVDSELANTEPQLPSEIQDSVPLSFGSHFCQLTNIRSYLCVSV